MLLGRDPALLCLSRHLEAIRGGRGSALALVGEAGIGKTALLAWAVASSLDMLVLRATGVESEVELAFSGLAELCLPLFDQIGELPRPQQTALNTAFALEDGTDGSSFALAMGTVSLLQAAGRKRPVLVVVDDAQWLDRASADALLFAMRRLHDQPVGTLVAMRSGELDLPGIETLELRGLGPEAALELVHVRAGVDPSVAREIVEATAGNPLAITELTATLCPDHLSGRRQLDDPLRVGPVIERAFARRVRRLSPRGTETLLLASAGAAHPFSELLPELSAVGLAEAEDAGFLRVVDDRIVFTHPLMRSSAYHSASRSARRAAHQRLARVLTDPAARAWHLAASVVGTDEVAATALEQVGVQAAKRSGHAPAAAAFRRAASLTADAALRIHRLHLAAEAATLAGHVAMARSLIDEAQQLDPTPAMRAELEFLLGLLLIHSGEDATSVLAGAGRSIVAENPTRAALMLAWASEGAVYRRDWETALRLAEESAWVGDELDPVVDFWSSWMCGVALTALLRFGEARSALVRAVEIFEQRVVDPDARLLANYSVALMYLDDFRGGLLAAEQAAAAARRHGAAPVLLFASSFELVARVVLGDWDRAQLDAAELHGLAVALDNRSEEQDFLWAAAYVAAARGDGPRLAELLPGARDDRIARCEGLLALGREDPEGAVAALEPLVVPGSLAGYADPDLSPFDLIEAYLRCRRDDEASALIQAFAPVAGRAWAAAALARVRALEPGADWEVLCEESRTGFAAIGYAFEEARTDLCLGELLRRDRRRGAAREPLARSLATFERLGAKLWADRARAGLRAAGLALSATVEPGSALDLLTERERQVVEAAAHGRTNKEIAAQLFLSPRTVELHLSAAFRKLGIRRRSELVGQLGQAEDADRESVTREV